MKNKNIVISWREHLRKKGISLAAGVDEMNAFTRLNTRPSYVWEWENGKRKLPEIASGYILDQIFIESILESGLVNKNNIDINLANKLKDNLKLPARSK